MIAMRNGPTRLHVTAHTTCCTLYIVTLSSTPDLTIRKQGLLSSAFVDNGDVHFCGREFVEFANEVIDPGSERDALVFVIVAVAVCAGG